MITTVSIPALQQQQKWPLLFGVCYGALAVAGLRHYLPWSSLPVVLGAIALVTAAGKPAGGRSGRFGFPALVLAVLYLLIPAKTILFAALALAVFFMIESFAGRIQTLAMAALALMSPIFDYFCTIFSFPIRLSLTQVAGSLLRPVYPGIQAEGNVLVREGESFAVDPACMGLHMLTASLLAVIILVAVYRRHTNRRLTGGSVFLLLGLTFLLNIAANLLRILCLVCFSIGPDSFLHGFIGAAFFLLYVLFPGWWLIRYWTRRFDRPVKTPAAGTAGSPTLSLILKNATLLSMMALVTIQGRDQSVNRDISLEATPVPGYTTTTLQDKIIKLENEQVLIYVKPIAGFYASDHQPMICWKGSGYQFKKVQEIKRDGRQYYTAILEKGTDRLYAAWWYETTDTSTISQWNWRWQALTKGKQYALVNVTTATPETLREETRKLFHANLVRTMTTGRPPSL